VPAPSTDRTGKVARRGCCAADYGWGWAGGGGRQRRGSVLVRESPVVESVSAGGGTAAGSVRRDRLTAPREAKWQTLPICLFGCWAGLATGAWPRGPWAGVGDWGSWVGPFTVPPACAPVVPGTRSRVPVSDRYFRVFTGYLASRIRPVSGCMLSGYYPYPPRIRKYLYPYPENRVFLLPVSGTRRYYPPRFHT
jgi:hypothetical protein